MEPSGGNQWQPVANERPENRENKPKHGKEGVDGSSPSEGFEVGKKPAHWLVLLSEPAPQGTSL
jgi:hypothetical protein